MLIASDLVPTIKRLAASFLEEIGDETGVQNAAIFEMLTMALRRLAHIAYQEKKSDALYISTDDDAIFQIGGSDISDMYAPLRIIDPNGRDMQKRVSFPDTRGWFKDASNLQINIKGFTYPGNPLPAGDHILHYIHYPSTIASLDSIVQFPDAGAMGLCYYVAGLILESRPTAKDLVSHYMTLSKEHLKIVQKASITGRGTFGSGYVPSMADVDEMFGSGL
jgi:hypothetical protein